MNGTACLFCSIARGQSPSTVRWQNEHWIAIDDIRPKATTHVLVVSKEHVVNLMDAAAGQRGALTQIVPAVCELVSVLGLKSYKLVINNGRDAGQVVDHLHAHVLSGSAIGSV